MRSLAIALLFAAAAPVAAQTGVVGAQVPASMPSMPSMQSAPIAAECPSEHAAMGRCPPTAGPPRTGPSAGASVGADFAADAVWGATVMGPIRQAVYAEHGSMQTGKLSIDRLEYRAGHGPGGYSWEGEAWYGGDYDRLWLKSMGDADFGKSPGSAEVQALWSHAIDPWFNLQTGVRYDIRPRPGRTHLVVGVQGLTPYLIEVDAAAFLSDRGELTGRFEAEYDQRITNRLILQPRIEINLAAQDSRSIGVGAGLSSIEAGLRLRYAIVPEFAPYLGIDYDRLTGNTADFARAAGRGVGGGAFVAGMRTWF